MCIDCTQNINGILSRICRIQTEIKESRKQSVFTQKLLNHFQTNFLISSGKNNSLNYSYSTTNGSDFSQVCTDLVHVIIKE